MKISILREAQEDLIAGYLFYEIQGSGVGNHFLDSLNADIEDLILLHGFHPVHLGFYRKLAKTFPYSIYYRIDGEVLFVDAIIDQRRNPSMVRSLLKSRGN